MATFFTVGLQTGAKRYSSWNVSSPDFDIDSVDISNSDIAPKLIKYQKYINIVIKHLQIIIFMFTFLVVENII